nr:hypothetical protein [Tanacetum cinerariifolium]
MISEAVIRDVLRLDDAEGVHCLPNEEIFTGLARMGYEKPSTKLTFYKAFFSSQWKFLIHTILQSLSAKRMSWNEFSFAMASAVICLSTEPTRRSFNPHHKMHFPCSDPKDFANMRRVGKGFSGVEMPLFEDAYVALTRRVEHLEHDKVAQDLEITKLKTRVKKLERANKVKPLKLRRLRKVGTFQRIELSDDTIIEDVINQGRMIDEFDRDEGVALMGKNEEEKKAKEEVVEVVTTAKLITEVVTAASAPVSAACTIIPATEPNIPAVTIIVAPVKVAIASTRRRRGVVIRDPKEESTAITPAETKDKGKGIMTEAQARRNMITYLKNTVGFRLDYFKGMSYDDIRLIFEVKFNANMEFLLKSKEQIEEDANRALESINETLAQKAAKQRRLNKEDKDVEEIK